MKPLLFSMIFMTAIALASGQNITVVSKSKCAISQDSVVKAAKQKFKPVLDELLKEGRLVQWNWYQDSGEQVMELIVDNEAQFKQTMEHYDKRISSGFPDAYRAYLSACSKRKDSIIHRVTLFPVIRSNFFSGVIKVENIDVSPDPLLTYNVVFDFTATSLTNEKMDSAEVNWGLTDVGRIYNLHAAAGVPKKNINFVLAVHAGALRSFYTNEAYRKKYKMDNPNLTLIRELNDAGVKFLMCGQAMTWLGVNKSMLIPEAKVTLTAQTTITSHQVQGYAILPMHND